MNKYLLIEADVVLMVIDIQDRLIPAMKYGEQVIQNTNILISVAKKFQALSPSHHTAFL